MGEALDHKPVDIPLSEEYLKALKEVKHIWGSESCILCSARTYTN